MRSIDYKVPQSVLIHLLDDFYSFDSFWVAIVPGQVGSSTVNTLLSPLELGALFLTLWIYCSCTVSILGPGPVVPYYIAKLIVLEAMTKSEFS